MTEVVDMTSEKERPVAKISYEKPTAVDLGPTAPIVGASCVPGGQYSVSFICEPLGNAAAQGCDPGNSAGVYCGPGSDGRPF